MHCSSQHTICQRACNCNSEQRFGVPGRCEGMRRVRDVAHSSTTHTHTHTQANPGPGLLMVSTLSAVDSNRVV